MASQTSTKSDLDFREDKCKFLKGAPIKFFLIEMQSIVEIIKFYTLLLIGYTS